MSSAENITQKILAEADRQAALKREEAERDAKATLASFEAQARQLKESLTAGGRKEAAALLERVASQAQMNDRNLKLRYRRQAISQAFDRALERLCALPEEEYVDFLAKIIAENQTADAKLILNGKDKALAPKIIAAAKARQKVPLALECADTAGDFAGGVIIAEGPVETNCSFEVLLKSRHDELEAQVAKILFAGE